MKKVYVAPEMDFILVESMDVIMSSGIAEVNEQFLGENDTLVEVQYD